MLARNGSLMEGDFEAAKASKINKRDFSTLEQPNLWPLFVLSSENAKTLNVTPTIATEM